MPKATKQRSHTRRDGGGAGSTARLSGGAGGPAPSGRAGGLGQHFLKNPMVVSAIVQKAGIKSTDVVLEIGPGNGAMTLQMLRVAKRVIAMEIDVRMIAELQKQVQAT